MEARATCPRCGENGVPIVYGLPGERMMDAIRRGEIVGGGCIVSRADPAWICRACGFRWGRVEEGVAWSPPQSAMPTTSPASLKGSIGGFMGDSYVVELSGATLTYHHWAMHYEQLESVEIKPSPTDWARFRVALDRIEAWSWPPVCECDLQTTDGTFWSAQIDWGDQKLRSEGENAYPPGRDNFEPTPEFDAFCRAVGELVDGRAFE